MAHQEAGGGGRGDGQGLVDANINIVLRRFVAGRALVFLSGHGAQKPARSSLIAACWSSIGGGKRAHGTPSRSMNGSGAEHDARCPLTTLKGVVNDTRNLGRLTRDEIQGGPATPGT